MKSTFEFLNITYNKCNLSLYNVFHQEWHICEWRFLSSGNLAEFVSWHLCLLVPIINEQYTLQQRLEIVHMFYKNSRSIDVIMVAAEIEQLNVFAKISVHDIRFIMFPLKWNKEVQRAKRICHVYVRAAAKIQICQFFARFCKNILPYVLIRSIFTLTVSQSIGFLRHFLLQ